MHTLKQSIIGIQPTHVRAALQRPLLGLPAQLKMSPPERPIYPPSASQNPHLAGVLVLVYPKHDSLHLVLTKRTDQLEKHKGQISFPGGRQDRTDASLVATALREAHEEIGVSVNEVSVIGKLTELYVPPSHFLIHPVVAMLDHAPTFCANHAEVAEIIEVTLGALMDDTIRNVEPRALASLGGKVVMTPCFCIGSHAVWGATAMILSEFVEMLRL
jgi:8-oxo-dGTP pyrophosphatase MutT (NUDIX family)